MARAGSDSEHPKDIPLEFSAITKYIYIGTNMCCIGHFDKRLKIKYVNIEIICSEIKKNEKI